MRQDYTVCCPDLNKLGVLFFCFQSCLNPPRKKSAKSARNSKAADSSTAENEQKARFIRKYYKGYVFHVIFKITF